LALTVSMGSSVKAKLIPVTKYVPEVDLPTFKNNGFTAEQDPFVDVRATFTEAEHKATKSFIPKVANTQATFYPLAEAEAEAAPVASFVEVAAQAQVGAAKGECEICMAVVQKKQRGAEHFCDGLSKAQTNTCVEILQSLLRSDKAVAYWIKQGCMKLEGTGVELMRPCPPLTICSYVPSLFFTPTSIIRDDIPTLCPKDPKFMPVVPKDLQVSST